MGRLPPRFAMAQLESQSQQQEHEIHYTKSLICALNLVSRNLPLPPDLYDAVSSICFAPEDTTLNASLTAALGAESDLDAVRPKVLNWILLDSFPPFVERMPSFFSLFFFVV